MDKIIIFATENDCFGLSYDELLIGYKSRHHSIEPEQCHHAFNNFGTFRPVILWQQKITGKWSRQNLSTTFFFNMRAGE